MTKLIDGKAISRAMRRELKKQVIDLKKKGIVPGLAVVIVGEDPASQTYVRSKERMCERIGVNSIKISYDVDVTEEQLLASIAKLNEDPAVHGILVQLPLPNHIDSDKVIHAIAADKDVDGFHPVNIGQMFLNESGFWSCTPHGVIELLDRSGIEIEGKHAVIVGASNNVGKPMAMMLLNREATITVCHIKTKDLAAHTRQADIIVVAVGRPNLITADMVKEGAVVVDVGINRLEDGRLVGDVDFENVSLKTSYITPVPGGVGPMTIIMLMKSTIQSAIKHAESI